MFSTNRIIRGLFAISAGIALLTTALPVVAKASGKAFNIEGTYKLVSRDLPDGTKQHEPEVVGLLTLTKDMRNFNVSWKDKAGKHFSAAAISKYKLSATEFSETNVYSLMNDEIGGKGLLYDSSDTTSSSMVKATPHGVEFQLPLHGEPSVEFTKTGLTATMKGQFVDHWEKVR